MGVGGVGRVARLRCPAQRPGVVASSRPLALSRGATGDRSTTRAVAARQPIDGRLGEGSRSATGPASTCPITGRRVRRPPAPAGRGPATAALAVAGVLLDRAHPPGLSAPGAVPSARLYLGGGTRVRLPGGGVTCSPYRSAVCSRQAFASVTVAQNPHRAVRRSKGPHRRGERLVAIIVPAAQATKDSPVVAPIAQAPAPLVATDAVGFDPSLGDDSEEDPADQGSHCLSLSTSSRACEIRSRASILPVVRTRHGSRVRRRFGVVGKPGTSCR